MEENTRLKGFNSILVQLKASSICFKRLFFNCFNSTLVQLKVMIIYTKKHHPLCFNSTLVQLKDI